MPYIIRDLKDYDLVKQKSVLQDKRIVGLQAISQTKDKISIRQNIRLEQYAQNIIRFQSQNSQLIAENKALKRKVTLAKIEVWAWRGGAIIYGALKLKQLFTP